MSLSHDTDNRSHQARAGHVDHQPGPPRSGEGQSAIASAAEQARGLTPRPSRRNRVVIVGGGFAGAYCARELERLITREQADVLLIDRHNYFVFYPLLVEAGTGALEPSNAVVSIRSFLKRTRFLMADVASIDVAGKSLDVVLPDLNERRRIEFDHLVLAVGSVTKMFSTVPGLREHAYEMKTLGQAVALRDRAVQLLEQADTCVDPVCRRRLLHMVVVGGGFTGVEVAGEFHEYMRTVARRYPNLDPGEVRMTLIDINDRILKMLDHSLSDWATQHLRKRGIDIVLKNSVSEVRADGALLRDGRFIEAATVIWTAGLSPPPLLGSIDLPKDRGWLIAERDCRVKGHREIWAIGDCAVNPDPQGDAYPATAQHAVQLGVACARNIARAIKGKPTQPTKLVNRGTLAAFGRYDAVARVYGVKLTGFIAWFLWRTIYLMKMPGLRRGLRVAWDWTADLLFDRDYVELGVHRMLRGNPSREAGAQGWPGGRDHAGRPGSSDTAPAVRGEGGRHVGEDGTGAAATGAAAAGGGTTGGSPTGGSSTGGNPTGAGVMGERAAGADGAGESGRRLPRDGAQPAEVAVDGETAKDVRQVSDDNAAHHPETKGQSTPAPQT